MTTEADRPNTGALATICAVLFLSILGIALAVTAMVRTTEEEQVGEKSLGARAPFDEMATQQKGELSKGFEWTNRDAGFASVPIERAMELVLKSIQADPESATPPAPPAVDAGSDAEATSGDAGLAGDADETAESDAGAPAAHDAAAGAPGEGQEIDDPLETPKPKKPKKPTKPGPGGEGTAPPAAPAQPDPATGGP